MMGKRYIPPSESEIHIMPETVPPTTEQPPKDPTIDELLQQLNEIKLNTVPKDKYDEAIKNNGKLVKQLATERPVVQQTPQEPTKEDILNRCRARTDKLGKGNSYEDIKGLVENYHDMQLLEMETPGVDETVIEALDSILKESNGDNDLFKSLMSTRFKNK